MSIHEFDVEATQPRLVGREHVNAASGILLAVEGEVVLEHLHGEFRRREGIRLHQHRDGREVPGSCAGPPGCNGYGAPPMPWPDAAFAVLNGLAASPGRTEM